MKKYFILPLALLLATSLWADVVNGSVDVEVIYDATSINVADDLDIGWSAYSASEYDLSYGDIWSTGLVTQDGYWFGQIYTDNYLTYGNGSLTFDVTVIGARDNSMFEYAIYGTDSADSSTTTFSLNTDASPVGAGTAWTLLDSGSIATAQQTGYEEGLNFGSTAYKYLAVRFRFSGDQGGDAAVKNISVVPEPATIGLLCIGCVLTLTTSRIRRNRHQA